MRLTVHFLILWEQRQEWWPFSVTHIFPVFALASCLIFSLSTYKFSILISIHVLKELVERINFDKRSENFPEVIILSILIILYHDDILKLLRENWFWSLLGSLICCFKTIILISHTRVRVNRSWDSGGPCLQKQRIKPRPKAKN